MVVLEIQITLYKNSAYVIQKFQLHHSYEALRINVFVLHRGCTKSTHTRPIITFDNKLGTYTRIHH